MYLLYCLEAALYGQLKKTLVISRCSPHCRRTFLTADKFLCQSMEYQRAVEVVDTFRIPKYWKQKKKTSVTKCYDLSNAIWWTDLVSLLRKSRSGREKLIRDRDDFKSSALAWLCLHGNHCLAEEQCVADVWVFCLFIFCFWKQHL